MKELCIVILAASLGLPGCATQRRIENRLAEAQRQMDTILATAPPLDRHVLSEFKPLEFTEPKPTPDATFTLAPDTAKTVVSLDSLDQFAGAGKMVDTGGQVIRITKTDVGGTPSLSVESVTKPKEVQVFLPAQIPAPNQPEQSLWLYALLSLTAGLGMAAQMILKWLSQRHSK